MGVAVHDDVGVHVGTDQTRRIRAANLMPVRDDDADLFEHLVNPLHQIRSARRIGVAPDGADRRDGGEFDEHIGGTDVTRMDDQVNASQRVEHFGPHEAVRVGDETNGEHAGKLPYPAPGRMAGQWGVMPRRRRSSASAPCPSMVSGKRSAMRRISTNARPGSASTP